MHHFAALLGYGACAINPYLAHESIRYLIETKMLDKDYYAAVKDYDNAVLHGIVKIASKMGISTIQSYQGSISRFITRPPAISENTSFKALS